jgi:predicted kinase
MELIILIGLQASGKSTFYQTRFAATHTLVSKDLLPNATSKDRRQQALIVEALAAGRSVVVDNTNPTPAVRAPLIALGQQYGATIAGFYLASNLGACLERNRQRVGRARVPDVALFSTRKQLLPPTYAEGFDQIFFVRIGDASAFTVEPWYEPHDPAVEPQ